MATALDSILLTATIAGFLLDSCALQTRESLLVEDR